MESERHATPLPKKPASRLSTVRYVGFECTSEGRSYRLRVDGAEAPRLVTVTIPNEAFSSRKVRFQDAPEFSVARVQREVDSNGELRDGLELLVTPGELDEYREAQAHRSPERKSRTARSAH